MEGSGLALLVKILWSGTISYVSESAGFQVFPFTLHNNLSFDRSSFLQELNANKAYSKRAKAFKFFIFVFVNIGQTSINQGREKSIIILLDNVEDF